MTMQDFRTFLRLLSECGELVTSADAIDLRDVSATVARSKKAVRFTNVLGYEYDVVSGILGSRERMAIALGCQHRDIGKEFLRRIQRPLAPELVTEAPVKDVVILGDHVDLTALPVPLISCLDGGPYITSGIGISKDPHYGRNIGAYRLMLRSERETSIDLVGASDLKLFYERAFKKGEPLPFAVAIGTHPSLLMAAAHMAPTGQDEYSLAGGLAGEPVRLVKCETIDLEVPADAEIILEGELLPIGWTEDEGRFGDFTGFVGPIKWNPVFRVNAITHRRQASFYALHMPDEVDYLVAPPLEGSAWNALANAGIAATAVYAPQSAGCNFHLYAAIKKRPGEGKNALLALLSLKRTKHAMVTDSDIDIFDPVQREHAIAYRFRPSRDLMVLDGARGSHLDPSIQIVVTKGALSPLTSKWGIDATIPEGADLREYELIRYPTSSDAVSKVSSKLPNSLSALSAEIRSFLSAPKHFNDVLVHFHDVPFRTIVKAWANLRRDGVLRRELETGRYVVVIET